MLRGVVIFPDIVVQIRAVQLPKDEEYEATVLAAYHSCKWEKWVLIGVFMRNQIFCLESPRGRVLSSTIETFTIVVIDCIRFHRPYTSSIMGYQRGHISQSMG